MSKTDTEEVAVLEAVVGKTAYPSRTAYVGLFTAAPSDSTAGTEVSGGSYARKSTAGSDWASAAAGSPSSIANANSLAFPAATGSWGTVTHFGIFTASTGGTLLRWAALTSSRAVGTGDVATFAVGALVLTED